METKYLPNLKIHQLSQAQYDREEAAGNLDPDALYLTPDAGSAPAGFGLGMESYYNVSSVGIDNTTKNGWYRLAEDKSPVGQIAILRVDSYRTDLTIVQTIYPVSGGLQGIELRRYSKSGIWQPWEWVNPPMVPGVEYRTTERWQDKPVYTMLIDIGETPVGTPEQKTDKEIILTVNGITRVIDYKIYLNSDNKDHPGLIYTFTLPDGENRFNSWTYAWPDQNRFKIGIGSYTDEVFTAYAIVKYLK